MCICMYKTRCKIKTYMYISERNKFGCVRTRADSKIFFIIYNIITSPNEGFYCNLFRRVFFSPFVFILHNTYTC